MNKNELSEALGVIGAIIAIPLAIVTIFFGFYAFVGFLTWLFTDPLNWISEPPAYEERAWDICVSDARGIFAKFNDLGATYALEDEPSKNVREFMKFCLENNTPNKE